MRCDVCGGEAPDRAVLCTFCGHPFGLVVARPGPPPVAQVPPQGAPLAPPPVRAWAVEPPNTSGMQGWVPPEVARGFNWGAFLPTGPFWAFAMGMPGWGLLAFCLSLPIHLALGFKGNEWAWQHRRFESVAQFHRIQRAWAAWGVAMLCLLAVPAALVVTMVLALE